MTDKNGKKTGERKPVIGITTGDINGIGPEVVIKALLDPRVLNLLTPVIYGSTRILNYYKKLLNLNDFNYTQVKEDNFHPKKINVVNCWEEHVEVTPGKVTQEAGNYAFKSLEKATLDVIGHKIDALVTAPINKSNIQNESFQFNGQTDYLAQKAGEKECLMMMAGETLRVGLITTHIPIRDVPVSLSKEKIITKCRIFINSLKKDFGSGKPRLAVLSLNPHGGEEGLMGHEEKDLIIPAIEELKSQGILVYGPFPPDGFFGSGQYRSFDGILAMYHDQGLIPFKTLSFEYGVNFTAGLPFVRTSPDHGTAYNIAGKNSASEHSMLSALFMAKEIFLKRNPQFETSS